jgi:GNAT superfamily N-acetyltransferase
MAERKPFPHPAIAGLYLERKTEAEVDEQDLALFDALLGDEINSYERVNRHQAKERYKVLEALLVHIFARKGLTDRGSRRLSVVMAKTDDSLVGYKISSFDPKDCIARDAFLGVHSNYQKLGIGTKLVEESYDHLRALGIYAQHTRVRRSVIRIYDRLGVPYQITHYPEGVDGAYEVRLDLRR